MTVEPSPNDPAAHAVTPSGSAHAALRSALRTVALGLVVLLILGAGVGAAAKGLPGLWGALLGIAAAAIFSLSTVWSAWRTADASPTTTGAVILGTWLVKMVVIVALLAALSNATFYSKPVFVIVLLVGAIGSAGLDYLAVRRAQVSYVE